MKSDLFENVIIRKEASITSPEIGKLDHGDLAIALGEEVILDEGKGDEKKGRNNSRTGGRRNSSMMDHKMIFRARSVVNPFWMKPTFGIHKSIYPRYWEVATTKIEQLLK